MNLMIITLMIFLENESELKPFMDQLIDGKEPNEVLKTPVFGHGRRSRKRPVCLVSSSSEWSDFDEKQVKREAAVSC